MKRARHRGRARSGLRPSPIHGVSVFFRPGFPRRSLVVGILGALAVHAILAAVMPERISGGHGESDTPPRELSVLFSDREDEPEPPLPEEFVATNPDVPSNPPDETRHFASRDQQAAQEEPSETETPEETPRVEGEDLRSQNIVEGHPEPAWPRHTPVSPDEEERAVRDFPSVPERRPVPGSADTEPEPDEEGIHTRETEEDTGEDDRRIVGVNVPERERGRTGDAVDRSSPERPSPSPRPTLPRTHSAPVAERPGSTSRIGEIAIDARRSEFGTYLERMLEAIERQWHSLARAHLSASDAASRVRIRFVLDSSGRVEIVDVESSATHTGTLICQDAIEARAPFGNWSDDMIDVLGDEQTLTITFHYR